MFKSMSIRTKLLVPIILLVMMSIGASFLLITELKDTSSKFDTLIKTKLLARYTSKDVVAQLQDAGRLANLMLLQREPSEFNPTVDRLRATLALLPTRRDELRILAPEFESSIGLASQALDAMTRSLQPVLDMKAARDHDAAITYWGQNARSALLPAINALNETADKLAAIARTSVSAQIASTNDKIWMLILGIAASIAAISALAVLIVLRGVVLPLNQLTAKIGRLSSGDGNFELPEADRGDELGAMGRALLVFRENAEKIRAAMKAEEVTGEIGAVIAQAAQNDLTVRVDLSDKSGFLRDIGAAINQLLERSNSTLGDMSGKTLRVADAVSEASAAVGQVSSGVRSQNTAVGQVSQALTESATAIRMVSASANSANEKGVVAAKLVERGQHNAEDMLKIVEKIALNSRKISQITQVIAGIANRTHILSLNAAIEAARAGEHGKGFVVVSQEVGKLAESAAQNAQQITDIVEQATADAAAGRTASIEVKQTMDTIAGEVSQTSQMIRSIAVAMEEQQATVSQIESNVGDIRGIASSNAVAAEQITATMIQLSQLASEQRKQLETFKTG